MLNKIKSNKNYDSNHLNQMKKKEEDDEMTVLFKSAFKVLNNTVKSIKEGLTPEWVTRLNNQKSNKINISSVEE